MKNAPESIGPDIQKLVTDMHYTDLEIQPEDCNVQVANIELGAICSDGYREISSVLQYGGHASTSATHHINAGLENACSGHVHLSDNELNARYKKMTEDMAKFNNPSP